MKKICLAIICVIFLCAISASAFNLKDSLKKLNKMTGSRSSESDIVFKKTCDDIITFSNTSWDMSYNDIKKILLKKNYDIRIESQDLYKMNGHVRYYDKYYIESTNGFYFPGTTSIDDRFVGFDSGHLKLYPYSGNPILRQDYMIFNTNTTLFSGGSFHFSQKTKKLLFIHIFGCNKNLNLVKNKFNKKYGEGVLILEPVYNMFGKNISQTYHIYKWGNNKTSVILINNDERFTLIYLNYDNLKDLTAKYVIFLEKIHQKVKDDVKNNMESF